CVGYSRSLTATIRYRQESYQAKSRAMLPLLVRRRERRHKAVGQLQRAHQTVKRQRADFQRKTALTLLRPYETICLDDLQVAHRMRTLLQATIMSDACWAPLRAMLEATAADAGRPRGRRAACLHQPGL